MSKQKNPFGDFSFENVLKQMQDNPMMQAWQDNDMMQTMAKAFRQDEPMDFSELWEMQKKNLQTLNDVNMTMGDRMTTLAQKQAELMREAWESVQHYSNQALKSGDSGAEEQMKMAQGVFQKAMANMQDLSKEGMEMTGEATTSLQKRMSESVDELQNLMKNLRK